jgi:hypothetical protein
MAPWLPVLSEGRERMRAYHKTSIYAAHDFVVHLTADEAARLLEETDSLDAERFPTLALVGTRLTKPFAKYEESL